jgi:O-antigen/teichoic acid export membrane protein
MGLTNDRPVRNRGAHPKGCPRPEMVAFPLVHRLSARLRQLAGRGPSALEPVESQGAILGSASLSAAAVLVTLLLAVASLYLVRSLTTLEFGRVAFGTNIHLLLLTVAGLGLTTGVMSEVARSRRAGEDAWPRVRTLLALRIASVLAVLAVGAAWAVAAGTVLPALAGVAASLFIVQDFFVGMLAGQLLATRAAAVIVTQPVVYLLILVVAGVSTAEQVLAAIIAALSASVCVEVALLARHPIWGRPWRLVPGSLRHALEMSGYAYAITFLQIGFVVVPTIVLGSFGRFAEAAVLSIVLTLVRFVPDALSVVLTTVYFPRLAGLRADDPVRRSLSDTFVRLAALVAVPAALGLAIVGEPILGLLFSGRYLDLAPYLALASLLVVLLLAAASVAYARLAGYSLPWWTMDSGGGASSGGNYSLSGTIGQPDAGVLTSDKYRLEGGYWGGVGGVTPPQRIYLPLTVKN